MRPQIRIFLMGYAGAGQGFSVFLWRLSVKILESPGERPAVGETVVQSDLQDGKITVREILVSVVHADAGQIFFKCGAQALFKGPGQMLFGDSVITGQGIQGNGLPVMRIDIGDDILAAFHVLLGFDGGGHLLLPPELGQKNVEDLIEAAVQLQLIVGIRFPVLEHGIDALEDPA